VARTDPDDAQRRQEEGIHRAVNHAGITWVDYATRYMEVYLLRHRELFCDDVWDSGLEVPESPRAFGQVMKNALREGWMEPSSTPRRSAQSNNSFRTVYRSLIYVGMTKAPYPRWRAR